MSDRLHQFEDLAAKHAKSQTLRQLFESLGERAEVLQSLRDELHTVIVRHREARTGKKFRFTKNQTRTLKNFEDDAREGLKALPDTIARLGDVHLLNIALRSQLLLLGSEEGRYGSFRPEDREVAEKILAFRRETIRLIREYIAASEFRGQVEEPRPSSRSKQIIGLKNRAHPNRKGSSNQSRPFTEY